MDFRSYLQNQVNNKTQYAGPSSTALNYVGGDYTGSGTTGIDLPAFYQWHSVDNQQDPNFSTYLGGVQDLYGQYQQATGQTGDVQGVNTGTSGGTSSWTSQDQAAYDQGIAIANTNLGRLPTQLDTARGNIDTQFGVKQNEIDSSLEQAQTNFQGGQTQNQQQRVTNNNQINQQAQGGLRALLRQIGASGGGGGSAYLYSAPQIVGEAAQQDLGGANQNFAQNQRALTSNFDQFKRENEQQGIQLGDWRTEQRQNAKTNYLTNKNNLLNSLAQLNAQRSLATGGDPTAAIQPYIDQINTNNTSIDELAAFNPQFSGKTPAYQAPNLSQFTLRDNPQIESTMRNAQGGVTPYLNLLLGRDDREQRLA